MQQTIFCHFRPFFALLPHYWHQKLKFGKNVKRPGDVILLHICTISRDHMTHGSWDIKCKRQSFLSLWAIFFPLTLLTTEKIKFFEKLKNPLKILSFHVCVPQMKTIWCMVLEISSVTDIFFVILGYLFALLPLLSLDQFLHFYTSPLPP